MEKRIILHSDCNNFFASVEEKINPKLRNVPMAVCGSTESRQGIVLAKNKIAKEYNVVTAETVFSAKRKCRELVIVEPHYGKYSEYSKMVNKIYREYTDTVEMFGIDESWLDVSGSTLLFGEGIEIADKIRQRVKKELGITVSVGVSYNKVFAKMGSDYKKPDAVTEITVENFKSMLYPLDVGDMFMVGRNTAEDLNRIGIYTIGELASTPIHILRNKLGKLGETIHSYANGYDISPVYDSLRADMPKSVGNGKTFSHDLATLEEIGKGIMELSDEVSERLRKYGLKCGTIQVSVKNTSFKTVSKQKNLKTVLDTRLDIYNECMGLIFEMWKSKYPVRSLTVTCSHLVRYGGESEQIGIFDEKEDNDKAVLRNRSIDGTVDFIRHKYGRNSLMCASLMNEL